jgi:hypothetical protein
MAEVTITSAPFTKRIKPTASPKRIITISIDF